MEFDQVGITPEQKDYCFYPSQLKPLEFLSESQVLQYNELGFTDPQNGFEESEILAQRDYFDSLLSQLKANPQKAERGFNAIQYSLNCAHTRLRGLWEIMYSEKILPSVRDIIGPNVIAWATHYFCKLPGDEKIVSWHQDASYWGLSTAKTVTVWLAIDDADEENAAMQFLPKSHLVGHIPWQETAEDSVLNQEIQDISVFDSPYSNNLQAGQFSLHSSLLVHGSKRNNSNRRRCGLTIRYAPPDVIPLDPMYAKMSYFVCGDFVSPDWMDNIPPESDEL
jgi:hypothetical protein